MSVLIRQAVPEDAPEIYEMIRALAEYENEENSVKVSAEDLREQMQLSERPFECLLAIQNGIACGFALYFYTYSTWEGSRSLYLEDLFVYPTARGTGAGAALMTALATIAQENQCRRFEWSVLDWNSPAINFYERLGAEPVSGWTRYRMEGDTLRNFARDKATTNTTSDRRQAKRA
ncbi:GNAT family N-acetyltransferase [Candidatus Obscuribacterales bacterium]|nr:GNAT family N-acetyltransferase [Candidatus Obscuribacterales bacterium]